MKPRMPSWRSKHAQRNGTRPRPKGAPSLQLYPVEGVVEGVAEGVGVVAVDLLQHIRLAWDAAPLASPRARTSARPVQRLPSMAAALRPTARTRWTRTNSPRRTYRPVTGPVPDVAQER